MVNEDLSDIICRFLLGNKLGTFLTGLQIPRATVSLFLVLVKTLDKVLARCLRFLLYKKIKYFYFYLKIFIFYNYFYLFYYSFII